MAVSDNGSQAADDGGAASVLLEISGVRTVPAGASAAVGAPLATGEPRAALEVAIVGAVVFMHEPPARRFDPGCETNKYLRAGGSAGARTGSRICEPSTAAADRPSALLRPSRQVGAGSGRMDSSQTGRRPPRGSGFRQRFNRAKCQGFVEGRDGGVIRRTDRDSRCF